MFGDKNLGKCTMYISIEVIPRLFCPGFYFIGFSHPNARQEKRAVSFEEKL